MASIDELEELELEDGADDDDRSSSRTSLTTVFLSCSSRTLSSERMRPILLTALFRRFSLTRAGTY